MGLKLALAFLLAFTGPAIAETKWVLQKNVPCTVFAKPTDNQGDFVLHKCGGKDFPSVWLLYQDSARAKFGFGDTPNFSSGTGSLMQAAGPVQWGGTYQKGKFVPYVAIARLHFEDFSTEPPKQDSSLQVFRLLPGGTSCLIGTVGHVANQNAKAKIIGERAARIWNCLGEPELFGAEK